MKRILLKISISLIFLLFVTNIFAQATKVRLNEVMLCNDSNYIDEFGVRNGWVEIFNTSYGTADIGGCYLTDDMNNPTKYFIQKGDVETKMEPRQHLIFFIDNKPSLGTFHVNFKLDDRRFVALFNADGKTLIDSVSIPKLSSNISYGRMIDGVEKLIPKESWAWRVLEKTTPCTNNVIAEGNESVKHFKEKDPIGIGMAITAMAVVFSALFILYIIFKYLSKLYDRIERKKKPVETKSTNVENTPVSSAPVSDEVYAAIAIALHQLSDENHDVENTVLTIDTVSRRYSPWSSKIYTLRQIPNVNKNK